MRRADNELLSAYVDGVAELDADERKRVEKLLEIDPDARADAEASREMIDRLRALPGEGTEPDWSALEQSIRQAVGPSVPSPWWRRLRWLAPIGALATTAAIAVLWLHHPVPEPTPPPVAPNHAVPPQLHVHDRATAADDSPPMAFWLDDQAVDIGNADLGAVLDDFDRETGDGAIATDGSADSAGLLPADDLGWVDSLDDTAIDRAESWLERKKS
ncbi:MAG TPA: hypothetical protein VLX92_17565 [Kofleriaceae bacterium]|nr:hypothetical protein [Kofleriaceae bacterium]